jgi:hypothetical protein
MYGTLMMRPPTTRPSNISTHTIRLPSTLSAVTFLPCVFLHLYNPSRYFLSIPGSWWMFCHMRHDVHTLQSVVWLSTKQTVGILSNVTRVLLEVSGPGWNGWKKCPSGLRISFSSLLQSCNVLIPRSVWMKNACMTSIWRWKHVCTWLKRSFSVDVYILNLITSLNSVVVEGTHQLYKSLCTGKVRVQLS